MHTSQANYSGMDLPGEEYDRPENAAYKNSVFIVVPQLGQYVVLERNFRITGENFFPSAISNYIKEPQSKEPEGKLAELLGAWCWEAPQGLAPPMFKEETFESFVARTAKLEALEEAGLRIEDAKIAGLINGKPSVFTCSQYQHVVRAKIWPDNNPSPDKLESIDNKKLFTIKELRELKGRRDLGKITELALLLCDFDL